MDIHELIKERFGYDRFLGGQEGIIKSILAGRDVLAVMPTGAGKSLCYQLPALMLEGVTIVVSPLISLMTDQVKTLVSKGISAACINSTLTDVQIRTVMHGAENGAYKLLYVAPERLESRSFRELSSKMEISLVAVDEAHCISLWGEHFRPVYRRIDDFVSSLDSRPVIAAFTATATKAVRKDIRKYLRLRDSYTYIAGFDRENLYLGVFSTTDKTGFIIYYLKRNRDKSGLIYCSTRMAAEKVAEELQNAGINALPYHAGMNAEDRTHSQEEFISGRVKVISATSAFGMGIDKPDIRFVIHYDLAPAIEDYYQQIGRAGRDGKPAECLLLFHRGDSGEKIKIIKRSHTDMPEKERKALIRREIKKQCETAIFADSRTVCLRKKLLSYFGESYPSSCGYCSVCAPELIRSYIEPTIDDTGTIS